MPLHDKKRHLTEKTVLLLLAVGIGAVEYFFPRIPLLPWLKPGLANVVTIVWIIRYGTRDALVFAFLRSWITGMFFGFTFLTLALSLSGATLACIGMGISWRLLGREGYLGTVGLGIIGALLHNLGQLVAVFGLLTGNYHIFYQLPIMIAASVVFGTLVGLFVPSLMRHLEEITKTITPNDALFEYKQPQSSHAILNVSLFAFCVALMFIEMRAVLIAAAVGISVWVLLVRRSPKLLVQPITRFWMLFAFVGAMHLFFTYGQRLSWLPGTTQEGLERTITQWLRIWSWLQTGVLLSHYRFHALMLKKLYTWFSGHQATLLAGIWAAEYFPLVVANVRKKAAHLLRLFVSKPSELIEHLLRDIVATIGMKE